MDGQRIALEALAMVKWLSTGSTSSVPASERGPLNTGEQQVHKPSLEPVCAVEAVLVAVANIVCRCNHHTVFVAGIDLHLNNTGMMPLTYLLNHGREREASRNVGAFPLMTSSGMSLPHRANNMPPTCHNILYTYIQ